MKLENIGILGHPLRPETSIICDQVGASLAAHGISFWSRPQWTPEEVLPLVAESSLVVAIGGDGAMLRAGRICGLLDVPILGINAGYLGFLTEAKPDQWADVFAKLLTDQLWIEERMMIQAELWRDEVCVRRDHALNDVVIGRGASGKLVLLDLYIDDDWTTTYNADGLIIATPTGSTAYSLAAGGPILPPELKNILIVPVAPHLTLDRPLVLAEGANVEVEVIQGHADSSTLIADGETVAQVQEGDVLMIKTSDHRARFVRVRDHNYFYRSLLDRMEPRMPVRRETRRGRRSAITEISN